jgi:hypothetical protein
MNNSEIIKQNNILKKISATFLNVVDLFCNKYLFLTILLNIALVTKPVVSAISVTTGMYMYYTAETGAVGSRPCRFFGLLSGLYPDKYLFMTVFKIMYFAALLLISLAMYLLIKRLSDSEKKILAMFCLTLLASMLFKSSDREVLSLALMFAFACTLFALYYFVFGKGHIKYFSLVFAALAVIIDVRTVYLCVIIAVVMLVKKYRSEKNIKVLSDLMIILSLTVFTVSAIVSNDNKNADEVRNYFEARYSENYDRPNNYTDEDTGTYHMSNGNATLLPDGFFKVTAIDLVTEWVTNLADALISFTYEDIFQGLCYIYIPVIAIYNHLTESEEDKRKESVVMDEKLSV